MGLQRKQSRIQSASRRDFGLERVSGRTDNEAVDSGMCDYSGPPIRGVPQRFELHILGLLLPSRIVVRVEATFKRRPRMSDVAEISWKHQQSQPDLSQNYTA